MARSFTTFDAIVCESRIVNASGSAIRFDSDDRKAENLILFLRSDDGRMKHQDLRYKPVAWSVYTIAEPDHPVVECRFDVREIFAMFGGLPPGRYLLRLKYPAAAYKLPDRPGEEDDIGSPD
ncbi:MAG TPA: hypothetical protein VGM03_20750, partial [Phycisphaerae bacterium]